MGSNSLTTIAESNTLATMKGVQPRTIHDYKNLFPRILCRFIMNHIRYITIFLTSLLHYIFIEVIFL